MKITTPWTSNAAAAMTSAAAPAPAAALWGAASEQDFVSGAKTIPFLPTATTTLNPTFDLPEWMESREEIVTEEDLLKTPEPFLEEGKHQEILQSFKTSATSLQHEIQQLLQQQCEPKDTTNTFFSCGPEDTTSFSRPSLSTSSFCSGTPGDFVTRTISPNTSSFNSGDARGDIMPATSIIRPEDMLVPLSELRKMQQGSSSPIVTPPMGAGDAEVASAGVDIDARDEEGVRESSSSEELVQDATFSSETTVEGEAEGNVVFFPTKPIQDVIYSLEPQDNEFFSPEPVEEHVSLFTTSTTEPTPKPMSSGSASTSSSMIILNQPMAVAHTRTTASGTRQTSRQTPRPHQLASMSEPIFTNPSHQNKANDSLFFGGHCPKNTTAAATEAIAAASSLVQVPKIVIRVTKQGAQIVTPPKRKATPPGINDHHYVAKKRVTCREILPVERVPLQLVPQCATSPSENIQLVPTPTTRTQYVATAGKMVPTQLATTTDKLQLVPAPVTRTVYFANPPPATSPNIMQQRVPAAPTLPFMSSEANALIDEMLQLLGTDALDNMEKKYFDSSMVEANLDTLLSQLETENSQLRESEVARDSDKGDSEMLVEFEGRNAQLWRDSDVVVEMEGRISQPGRMEHLSTPSAVSQPQSATSTMFSQPHSPLCLPSPVPSVGRASPQNTSMSESMFFVSPVPSVGSPSQFGCHSPQNTTNDSSPFAAPFISTTTNDSQFGGIHSPHNTTNYLQFGIHSPQNTADDSLLFAAPVVSTDTKDLQFGGHSKLLSPSAKPPIPVSATQGETRTVPSSSSPTIRDHDTSYLETMDLSDEALFTSPPATASGGSQCVRQGAQLMTENAYMREESASQSTPAKMCTGENMYTRESAQSTPRSMCLGEHTQSSLESVCMSESTTKEDASSGAKSPTQVLFEEYMSESVFTVASPESETEDNDNKSTIEQPLEAHTYSCSSPLKKRKEVDDQSTVEPLEAHTYSRSSPLKKRSARRTTAHNRNRTPYSDDRRERKKEQNKAAALRYRQKKRKEDYDMMTLVRAEEERQKALKAQYTSLLQEVSCLKKIMRDFFIAKGVLSPDAFTKKKKK